MIPSFHTARLLLAFCSILAAALGLAAQQTGRSGDAASDVRFAADEAARRVDVLIDGRLFTAYIWPTRLKKPVLFPLRTAAGTTITRGYPLDPRPAERTDHPHHAGLWFNYGDVNGLDFWNNSEAIKPEASAKYGSIRHTRVRRAEGGKNRGVLEVEMEWVDPSGKTLLREQTTFVFHAGPNLRAIDRITRLTALDTGVVFNDNKEGLLGIRVARQLEQPSNRPEILTDASGKATTVPKLDNTGVTGKYLSGEGKTGDDVWGTRARWTVLTGRVLSEHIALAILDHPENPGHPTYWHARGYGLFAANPLGQRVFSNGKEELRLTLGPKQSVTFKHRVLILSGETTPGKIEDHYQRFIAEVR